MPRNCTGTIRPGTALPAPESFWTLARAWMGFALRQILTWRERGRQRRHLAMLDDRLLKDIGVTRADLDAEVRKPFWLP